MADRSSQAGFMLMEALVALVVAGLFLGTLARAFAVARGQARAPMESLSAAAVASVVEAEGGSADRGQVGAYRYSRRVRPVVFQERAAHLAPAPEEGHAADPAPPAAPKMPEGQTVAPSVPMLRIMVSVETPSGRRLRFEAIRRDTSPVQ